ncbi:MAG: recombinase zinc beta ribbon domain-containing protein [Bacteroidetes bacterium]|nr:recombinase zinc beta ribbon domain-containing protein [Bacteroidota bacterium]MCW5896690.1 recombinase zinc beta ribbon domain-containing protein [Bacteroidota bacterium]
MTVEQAHPAIISKDLFERANVTNRENFGKGNPHQVKSPYLLSGLIRCDHCGFNFSGHTYSARKRHYYQDSGFINKGRSVCTSFLIPKERIENFVISSIKENLLSSGVEAQLRTVIERQLQKRHSGEDFSLRRIEAAIVNNEVQTRNLVDAIAQGIRVDTVLSRVKELETERKRLLKEKTRLESVEVKSKDIRDLAQSIAEETKRFDEVLRTSPIHVQKQWIRRFVLGIVVERDKNRAVCHITRIPMTSHPIMKTLISPNLSIVSVPGTGLEPARPCGH